MPIDIDMDQKVRCISDFFYSIIVILFELNTLFIMLSQKRHCYIMFFASVYFDVILSSQVKIVPHFFLTKKE